MESVTPYKEVIDLVKEAGGSDLKLCYQCGTCSGVCPWNTVRSFMVRRIMHQAQLGLVDFESEDMWLCVTCRNCVQRCPRGVAIIDVMRSFRRGITELGVAKVPDSLRLTMKNISGTGNPFGEPAENRDKWSRDLSVKPYTSGTDWLYFVGCMASYDPKLQKIARAIVTLLTKAGVDFGILGNRENCSGESVRKVGDEALFATLAQKNIETFQEMGVKKILTTSPHCFSTFKNEYPEAGGHYAVSHYTQMLDGLLKEGRLKPNREIKRKVTYHDPCYLGRHNGIYDEPRDILHALPGIELVEMPRSREMSLCCGGGGGGIWRETKKEERFVNSRLEEAIATGADTLVVACPYCMTMFQDGLVSLNQGEPIKICDIAELVLEAVS